MTKEDKIILVGGGGHCRACIDVIEQQGRFTIANITLFNNLLVTNNLVFALKDMSPATHVIHVGTMGEYGTPTISTLKKAGWILSTKAARAGFCSPARPDRFTTPPRSWTQT